MSLTANAGLTLARTSQLRNGPSTSGAITFNPGFGAVGGLNNRSGDGGAIGYSQINGVPGGLNGRAGNQGAVTYVPGFGYTGRLGQITSSGGGIGRDSINGIVGGLGATGGDSGAIHAANATPGGLNGRGGDSGAITYNLGFGANGNLGDRSGSSGAITYQEGYRSTALGYTSGSIGSVTRQGDGSLWFGALGGLRGQGGAINRPNVDGQAGGLGAISGSSGAITRLNGFGVSGGLGFRRGFNSGNENRGNSSGTPTGTNPLRSGASRVGRVRPRKLRKPARVDNCCGLPASGAMVVDVEWSHDDRGRVTERIHRYALVAAGVDWTPATLSPTITVIPPGPFAEDNETLEPMKRRRTYNDPWGGCVDIAFDSPNPYGRVVRKTRQTLPGINGSDTPLLEIRPTQTGVCVYPGRVKIRS